MKKPLYRLYDMYDGRNRLVDTDSLKEVVTCARNQDAETDGECDLVLYKFDEEIQKYKIFEDWKY